MLNELLGKDIYAGFNWLDFKMMLYLQKKVNRLRARAGKQQLRCVVVEHDWPEYEPTWAAIERRVDGGPNAKG